MNRYEQAYKKLQTMAQHPVYTAVIAREKIGVADANENLYVFAGMDRRTQLPKVDKLGDQTINANKITPDKILCKVSNLVDADHQVSGQMKGLTEIIVNDKAEKVVPGHLYNYSSLSKTAAVLLNNM